ncbi:MAG: hypothetical protein ACRENE_12155 [Polyangiaceae bacterium]
MALPKIPPAPKPPRFGREAIAEGGSPGGVAAAADDALPQSAPTSPPPPIFTELRNRSRHPSPLPMPPAQGRDDARRFDSRSMTLPGPSAVPKVAVHGSDLSWFDLGEDARALLPLIDGVRTVAQIARDRGIAAREVQLRLADLRSRGVIEME